MLKLLKTKNHNIVDPFMAVDSHGNAHCLWKNDNVYCYSRFNGVDWEYLNDYKFVDSIPSRAAIPKNGICPDSNSNPYVLWAISERENIFGNLCDLYLSYWNYDQWTNFEEKVLIEKLYGSSLVFISNNIYIGSLILNDNRYMFEIRIYQGGHFVQLSSCLVSEFNQESRIVLKQVDNYIYCFWDNRDNGNYWIEHVVYDIAGNIFYSTPSKKINLSNDNRPFSGFDFISTE